MSFYHATYADRIDSILKVGLRVPSERNFPYSVPGVYLSTDPVLALSFLLEHTVENRIGTPASQLEKFRVIVVDRSRIDDFKLEPDPQIDDYAGVFWRYRGSIDVTGMPILAVGDVMPSQI